jgi:transcription antitermination protein NusB
MRLPGDRRPEAALFRKRPVTILAESDHRQHGASRRRSVARLTAVQALYQLEANGETDPRSVVREFVRHRFGQEIEGDCLGEADPELFADIVCGVADDREQLDTEISAALTEAWPLPRLDSVLRAILRAGAYELLHRRDVPPRVSLSEYTAIAHAFFTGKEPGLANGVLNHLAHTLRDGDL